MTEDTRYELAACGLLSTTPDDVVLSVNQTFLDLTGLKRDEVLGTSFTTLLTPSSQLFYETRYLPVLRLNGTVREVALSLVTYDGTPLPILLNSTALTDAEGITTEIRMAIFDATERQGYERDLLAARRSAEASEAKVRILQDASTEFLAAETEEQLAIALAERARDAFAAADSAVMLLNPDGSARVPAGSHMSTLLADLRSTRTAPAATGNPQFVGLSDLDEVEAVSPQAAVMLHRERFEALSSVALVNGDVVLGAVVCLYRRRREFDESVIELHHALARQAAQGFIRLRLQRELEAMALHDQLTGLANRNLLRERLSHAIASTDRTRQPMSLIFLDLDGFKRVNDDLGHRRGDTVLQTASERIQSVVRQSDIVGRFGGDEFLVVCENADAVAAELVADRIRAVLRDPVDGLPDGYPLAASVGVATYDPDRSSTPTNDDIVRAADAAMYRSKNAGGDQTYAVTVRLRSR